MVWIKRFWYIIFIIIMLIVILLMSSNSKKSNYTKINEGEALKMMAENVKIIDVRTKEEYTSGHIKEAINIPYDQISKRAVTFDKNEKIIVYCQSGNRSRQAAQILIKLGYTKVYDMGSLNNWTGDLVN